MIIAALMPDMALGLLGAYNVEPVKAQWSGWTRRNEPVSQTITCNFDSLVEVALFTGFPGTGRNYDLQVRDWETNELVAHQYGVPSAGDHQWLRFTSIIPDGKFVRGKRYEFRFTRPGDSIHYYYDMRDPYRYGSMPDDVAPTPRDLCMRVYGVMDTVKRTFFGMDEPNFVPWSWADTSKRSQLRQRAGQLADSAGIGSIMLTYLRWDQMCGDTIAPPGCTIPDSLWCDFDARLWMITQDAHARPVVNIVGTAPYASSRDTFEMRKIWVRLPDTAADNGGHWDYVMERVKTPYCAPRGLWNADTTNYWKMFIYSMITHLDGDTERRGRWPGGTGRPYDRVHVYVIWNEPNDTCLVTTRQHVDNFATGWWRRPNREYTPAEYPGLYGLCRLYVRMAFVAESVIRNTLPEYHQHDTILICPVHRCFASCETMGLTRGIEFIRNCYRIAKNEYGKIFWDGIALHPYQDWHDFKPIISEVMAESVRAVAREFGHYDCLVWNSEEGVLDYPGWNRDTVNFYHQGDAQRYLPAMFVTQIASGELPGARYDAAQWWLYSAAIGDSYGLIGLKNVSNLDDSVWPDSACWEKYSAYYATRHMTEELVGWRYESRISMGDSIRIYQFTHPVDGRRKWVGFRVQSEGRHSPKTGSGFIPARTDSVYISDVLGGTRGVARTDQTGWVVLPLGATVSYVEEPDTQFLRPDLRVDSVRVVASPPPEVWRPVVKVWMTNVGNRATPGVVYPETASADVPPTRVVVFWNGDSVAAGKTFQSIAPGETRLIEVEIEEVPAAMEGWGLLSVRVNPGQAFVELKGLDDNTGYQYLFVSR